MCFVPWFLDILLVLINQVQVVLLTLTSLNKGGYLYYLWTEVVLVSVLVESTMGYTINPRPAYGKNKTMPLAKSWTDNLKMSIFSLI